MPGGRGLTTPRAWQAWEHGPYAQQVARSVELEDDRTEAQGVVESWAGGGVSRGAPRPQPEARNDRAPSDPARSLDRVCDPTRDPLVAVAAGVEAIERQAVFEGEDVGRLHDRDERIVGESLDQLGVPVVDERIELAAEGSADERVVQPDHEHARLRTGAANDVYGLLDAAEDVVHEVLRIGGRPGPEVVAPEIVPADGDDDHVRLAQQPLDAWRLELFEQIPGPRAVEGDVDDVAGAHVADVQLRDQTAADAEAGVGTGTALHPIADEDWSDHVSRRGGRGNRAEIDGDLRPGVAAEEGDQSIGEDNAAQERDSHPQMPTEK